MRAVPPVDVAAVARQAGRARPRPSGREIARAAWALVGALRWASWHFDGAPLLRLEP